MDEIKRLLLDLLDIELRMVHEEKQPKLTIEILILLVLLRDFNR